MEENNQNNQTEEKIGKMKQWVQDNLRIIISVIIVVLIAGGIYSYSRRSENPAVQDQSATTQDQSASQDTTNQDQSASTANQSSQSAQASSSKSSSAAQSNVQAGSSQETDSAFVETAAKGQGLTHLARRALANYLEKNPDSSLTPEHKIYIEDYLRKNVSFKGVVTTKTSVEFSKDLIKNAIQQSQKLTSRQLKNLHKYAVLVPSLS